MNYYVITALLLVASFSAASSSLDITPKAFAQGADAPTVYTTIPPLTVVEQDPDEADEPETLIRLSDYFTDPDTNTLEYGIQVQKDSEPFDDDELIGVGNGFFFVIPTFESHGVYTVTITAQDGSNPPATGTFTVTIENVNRPLEGPSTITTTSRVEGDVFSGRVPLSDPDGPITCENKSEIGIVTSDCSVVFQTDASDRGNPELVVTVTGTNNDGDPEPGMDIKDVTFRFTVTPTVFITPSFESATDRASRSFSGQAISNVEIEPTAPQTFQYSINFYKNAPGLALEYDNTDDATIQQATMSGSTMISFLRGSVDIDTDITGDALVSLTYAEPDGSIDESSLLLWHFENERWNPLSTELDTSTNTISATASSFSPFAIGTLGELDGGRIRDPQPPEEEINSSGSSVEHLKAPTFGTSKLNNNQIVECGYSMDGQCTDVLNYHEEYKRQTIHTNSIHDFTLKAYGQSPIKQFQIGFGVPGVGEPINSAEAVIKVIIEQDNKSVYGVESVEIIDHDNTIDFDPQNAGVQKVSCTGDGIGNTDNDDNNGNSNVENGKNLECVELTLNDVLFREQFHSEPFVIHVVDNSHRSSHNYMNEGLLIQGQSLNPAPTASKLGMQIGKSDLVSFELTRTDKLANVWTDQFGQTWTQNQFGTWLQLTYPEVQHGDDASVKVMTRTNSNFADQITEQQNRASLVFDAAGITNSASGTFSHDYSGVDYDSSKTQKLADLAKIEQERAQQILDSIMGRSSRT